MKTKQLHDILQKGNPATEETHPNEAHRANLLARVAQERTETPATLIPRRKVSSTFLLGGLSLGALAGLGIFVLVSSFNKTPISAPSHLALGDQNHHSVPLQKPTQPIMSKPVFLVELKTKEKTLLESIVEIYVPKREKSKRKERKERHTTHFSKAKIWRGKVIPHKPQLKEKPMPEPIGQVIIERDNAEPLATEKQLPEGSTIHIALLGEKDRISTIVVTDIPAVETPEDNISSNREN
jgi:hypothetical protein